MFGSLLIANRGEIARRIIRTARRMGLRCIAVYSEADADAPHVREADEAVLLGPPAARESYLVQDKIITAARERGADAVHPGYGFLSENAQFAEAVLAAGLVWVGPPPAAIRAMGLKDAAKALMMEAGVPVTPGYHGEDQNDGFLAREAKAIGYPVLIKAVAGGGGKGMRKVERADDFAPALVSARREAEAAFGDGRVLIEKYVSRPRHIEVQIFGDSHGNVVHFFERDCSLQRRHQKVIEEAPAPGMDEATRRAVCGAAVKAAKAVQYQGAGTIEFIADASEGLKPDRIWFMEMNTRLQVEHPVTEMITGLDLVEWQLRVAAGEPLPLPQEKITAKGHAIEARLYAENPAVGFLPSTGPLTHFELPDSVRLDMGVEKGGVVTPYYDPMIAKLIAFASARAAAAAKLADACRKVEIWPVKTNAGFLAQALSHPDFIEGAIDTGFIEARLAMLIPPSAPDADVLAAAGRAWLEAERQDHLPWFALAGFRLNAPPSLAVCLQSDQGLHDIRVSPDVMPLARAVLRDGAVLVFKDGEAVRFGEPKADAGTEHGAGGEEAIRSPMPGKIVGVDAKAGDAVKKGQVLITLEAMKMELTLTAPFEGLLAEISVKAGDQVSEGMTLARLAPEE